MARQNSDQMRSILQHDDPDRDREVSGRQHAAAENTKPSHSGSRMEEDREKQNVDLCSSSKLKQIPQGKMTLGQLCPGQSHTILINVDAFYKRQLIPQRGFYGRRDNTVKMPCSPDSFLNAKTKRWDVICDVLETLGRKKSVSVWELQEAVMKYNPKYKGIWSFEGLAKLVKNVHKADNYFCELFPKIALLARQLDTCVMKDIPLLKSGQSLAITLSQHQIACLLANAFLCTFPHRNSTHHRAEYSNYPTINFSSLFGNCSTQKQQQKLRAILHYFKVVTNAREQPVGLVTFERHSLHDRHVPKWESCLETMPRLSATSHGSIENDGKGMLQVDFCNSLIGGGVLGSGLVQEEILFLMNPELIVARLFTERLGEKECLIIKGSQQFSVYKGYNNTFEWLGPYEDTCQRDEWMRLQRQTLAIDALNYKNKHEQYDMEKINRELNKAYSGFSSHEHDRRDIATGNWGCGVFNGDPELKAVIQLMAAAVAQRGLAFFTFGNVQQENDLTEIHHLLVRHKKQVGWLHWILKRYCQKKATNVHLKLFRFIKDEVVVNQSLL